MPNKARVHVPAGTFHISEQKPIVLQAFLGTCVGLALYCRETGVGGIIHLLLPQPISKQSTTQPEKYASTGIPLFIDALQQAGARRDNLSAYLAGGALVGPISQQDLDLDIGGRTLEAVRAILETENIKVSHSETGGFFTCCLNLDMEDGRCTIEPAGYNKLTDTLSIRTPSIAEIKQAMDHLQPIPQVALKVLRLMDLKDHDISAVAAEIRKDQVISARALQLANSAMFSSIREIDSLEHALVYLGQDMVVKLVISAAVQSYFSQSAMGYSLCKGGLYYHAVGCAHVAEALAHKTAKADPGIAYTAGLLHDIGKVVLDQYVAAAYPFFYRKVMDEDQSVQTIERRLFGIDHTETGYILARQWSFPPSLTHAIRYHHAPEKAGPYCELARITYLADLLLSRFNIGLEFERVDTRILTTHLGELNLNSGDLPGLVDVMPAAVFQAPQQIPFATEET